MDPVLAALLEPGGPSVPYIVGAATVCFLWHYAFTFHEEVELIWKRGRWDFSRFAYLWTRYITLGSLLLGVYVTSPARPHLNDSICQAAFIIIPVLGALTVIILHVYYAACMIELFQMKRGSAMVIWIAFLTTSIVVCVMLPIVSLTIARNTHELNMSSLRTCVITELPISFVAVFACMAIFHAVSLTCVCVNALHLPYRRGSDIIHRLRRDNLLAYASMMAFAVLILVMLVAKASAMLSFATISLVSSLKAIIAVQCMLAKLGMPARLARSQLEDDHMQLKPIGRPFLESPL